MTLTEALELIVRLLPIREEKTLVDILAVLDKARTKLDGLAAEVETAVEPATPAAPVSAVAGL